MGLVCSSVTERLLLVVYIQWAKKVLSYENFSTLAKKPLFFRSKNDPKFGVKLGVKVTPTKGVILYLKFVAHFWSYNNSLKITVLLSLYLTIDSCI